MSDEKKGVSIAYRCPECFESIYGLVGEFAYQYGMLRIKCTCEESNLDITPKADGKIQLSVPCLYCKQNHTFTVSRGLFFDRDLFTLACPYTNMNICFIGKDEQVCGEVEKNADEISALVSRLELEGASDLQPEEMSDAEILPDASVYDLIRLVLKELEADGCVDCPCHSGSYDLRYTDTSIQAFCPECGATYDFDISTSAVTHEHLNLDKIKLT